MSDSEYKEFWSKEELYELAEIGAAAAYKVFGGDYDEHLQKALASHADPFVGRHMAKDAGLLILAARATGVNIQVKPDEEKQYVRVYSVDKPKGRCLGQFWDKFKELKECHKSRDTN